MSRIIQLLVLLSAPLALVVAAFVVDRTFSAAQDGENYDYVVRFDLPSADAPVDLPRVDGPADASRPLVVIDPGHGGFDPGAGTKDVREKTVALRIAQAIRDRLLAGGGIRVALTRDTDRFVSLQDRPDIARRLNADLFISIHADSAGEKGEIGGASIYTLSSKASSEAAARFAERENSADAQLNGVRLNGQSEEVSNILVELSQRRVQETSDEFAGLITREGGGSLRFHPQARRSATLAVLRAPDVPAVLYESGFITNREDAERLVSQEGREEFAETMGRAIRIFFARQSNQ